MARTRKSLFSILESRGLVWDGCRVLDLFAGSGSLAYEALSRGAARAELVENSLRQCQLLAQNTVALDLAGRAVVVNQDVKRYLRKPPPAPFNLVFIDPPYRRNLAQSALELLIGRQWLAPGAFVAAELEKGAAFAAAGLQPEADRLFGQTHLHIWKYNENSPVSGNL